MIVVGFIVEVFKASIILGLILLTILLAINIFNICIYGMSMIMFYIIQTVEFLYVTILKVLWNKR